MFALHWELLGASGAVSGAPRAPTVDFSMNNTDCYSILGTADKTGNRGLAKIKSLGCIKGAAGQEFQGSL